MSTHTDPDIPDIVLKAGSDFNRCLSTLQMLKAVENMALTLGMVCVDLIVVSVSHHALMCSMDTCQPEISHDHLEVFRLLSYFTFHFAALWLTLCRHALKVCDLPFLGFCCNCFGECLRNGVLFTFGQKCRHQQTRHMARACMHLDTRVGDTRWDSLPSQLKTYTPLMSSPKSQADLHACSTPGQCSSNKNAWTSQCMRQVLAQCLPLAQENQNWSS